MVPKQTVDVQARRQKQWALLNEPNLTTFLYFRVWTEGFPLSFFSICIEDKGIKTTPKIKSHDQFLALQEAQIYWAQFHNCEPSRDQQLS